MDTALALTIPAGPRFVGVARLLVGGLAARLDLPYEQMDDLQLAAESALAVDSFGHSEVTLELDLREDAVEMRIAPFDPRALEHHSVRDEELDLGRLLSALVDEIHVDEHDGVSTLILSKSVALPAID